MDAEEIVYQYADMVYKIAYRYTANFADAEDIFSATFLRYFKKDRCFESEEHRKAWLIRVTINCAKQLLGERMNYQELDERVAAEESETSQDEILALRDAIEKLPANQKEVITLFYLQELPVKMIAEILGKSESAVKILLFRARNQLRVYLGD
ncbi:MAG: sigma-70 family RNA polymerase sigma factor [Clostridiales bacterium]|nr:sigma-70 family RNA polymerase sigma factor [Candidatus Cacconaster stercorequi]